MNRIRRHFASIACCGLLVALVQLIVSSEETKADWKITKSTWRKETAGYLSNTSFERGNKISVFVSCPANYYRLFIGKIGDYQGGTIQEIVSTPTKACLNKFEKLSRNWTSNVSLDTKGLEGGMYLIKIIDSEGFESYIPMAIRDSREKSPTIFVVPTMTMFAYNSWSGSNTYKGKNGFDDRTRIVDFRSPFDSGYGTGKYWKYVHPLIVELEKLGIKIDYVADTDLHFFPELLQNRKLYVSAGHDEYWTREERQEVINARKRGMNLVFFGANAGYWQVRLAKDKSSASIMMEIYKSKEEDPDTKRPTIRFRDAEYSESELNGVQYTCFPARGSFHSFDQSFFGFTGMSAIAFKNLNKVVGPEVDEVPSINKFAGSIKVVAEGKVKCGNRWIFPKNGRVNMVYGTSPKGGGVFSVGTMGWVLQGLGKGSDASLKEAVVTVTRNVVLRGIEGPFGR